MHGCEAVKKLRESLARGLGVAHQENLSVTPPED